MTRAGQTRRCETRSRMNPGPPAACGTSTSAPPLAAATSSCEADTIATTTRPDSDRTSTQAPTPRSDRRMHSPPPCHARPSGASRRSARRRRSTRLMAFTRALAEADQRIGRRGDRLSRQTDDRSATISVASSPPARSPSARRSGHDVDVAGLGARVRFRTDRAADMRRAGRPLSLLAGRGAHERPSLSTSGETLTIEESMTLRARTENAGHVGDEHEWSWSSG